MVRGPMMGLVMLGCSLHQASASCPEVYPFSVAIASTTSATAKGYSVKWLRPMRLGSKPYLDPSGDACSLRYLPVRKPPASGDHGNRAKPYVCATGMSSRSMRRSSKW